MGLASGRLTDDRKALAAISKTFPPRAPTLDQLVWSVTFTELAASELLIRVRDFVGELEAGRIPAELRVASAMRHPSVRRESIRTHTRSTP
jgi:hypothetical protein